MNTKILQRHKAKVIYGHFENRSNVKCVTMDAVFEK